MIDNVENPNPQLDNDINKIINIENFVFYYFQIKI